MINIRKQTKFWPFERPVLEIFISFTSKPPTTKNALLRFYPIQKDMQEKTSRQSSQRAAARQTVTEIEAWWIKAGFLCQSSNGLSAKVLELVNEQKQVTRSLKNPEEKEKNYTSNLKKAKIIYAKNRKKPFGL